MIRIKVSVRTRPRYGQVFLLLTFLREKPVKPGDVIRLITNPAMLENLAIYKHYGLQKPIMGR